MGRHGFAALAVVSMLALVGCNKSSSTVPPAGGGGSSSSAMGSEIGTATVSGVGTVLVDPEGFTLYYLKTESANHITCTGSCASTWPPYLVTGTMPTAGSGVTGTISEVSRPGGGQQVTYNGHPLYTYVSDTAPGKATGNGVSSFFVATPALKSSGGGGGGGGGSGYGYGS
jgi:predicted lipoprotein with Yx(FWY)xxD motif